MSTFYEALKKAESSNPGKSPIKIKKDIPLVFVIILAVFVFMAIFNISRARHVKKVAEKKKKATGRISLSKAPTTKPAPVIIKKEYHGYELEGIICKQDFCVAVINGKILKKEEKIDNMVVKKITPPQTVDLLNLENNITLTLKIQ